MKKFLVFTVLGLLTLSCQKEVITPKVNTVSTRSSSENADGKASSIVVSSTENPDPTRAGSVIIVDKSTKEDFDSKTGDSGGITDPNHDPSATNSKDKKRK